MMKWEKIFENHISGNELITRMYEKKKKTPTTQKQKQKQKNKQTKRIAQFKNIGKGFE